MTTGTKPKARKFTKMYGTGNDFVILPALDFKIGSTIKLGRDLCSRRSGIGADQLLIISKSRKADFRMQTINPDGSEAEMCGNGIRCAAKFLLEEKVTQKRNISFETLAGIKTVHALGKHSFQVDMGEPVMKGKDIPVNLSGRVINRPLKTDLKEFRITCLSMGNPHCVIFTEELENYQVGKFGPYLETYHIFPKRINVEFVHVVSQNEISMRVWERGAGETDGCGTGACAAVVASVLNGFTGREVTINQRGGKSTIKWDKDNNHILLTGSSEIIFSGEIEI